MKFKKIDKMWDYASWVLLFSLAMLTSRNNLKIISGVILILEGLFLYILNYLRTDNLADIRGLFSGSWIVGMGLSCLQLSALQKDWQTATWISFFCAYFFFMIGFDLMEKKCGRGKRDFYKTIKKEHKIAEKVMHCIVALTVVSIVCFIFEAVVLGFIPLFSPEPHAYSYFRISGVHYFTISSILNPALTVIYCKYETEISRKKLFILFIGNITAFAIPILCVSRFQMLFAAGFAIAIYLMLYKKITWKMIVGAIVVVIPLYVLLSIARRHDVTYLNGIFEMKNENMPIFITQPYMYIAANYDNFNSLVLQLTEYAHGLRMMFPVIALTGIKFIFPELINFPIYTVKTELTTLTLFYDAYYDFGIFGIVGFSLILGALAKWLTKRIQTDKNPIVYMFYGQIALYFLLSFFTTWFSNPTIWFWFAITFLMYLYVRYEKKGKNYENK